MEGIAVLLKGHEQDLATAEAKAVMHGWGFWRHTERSDEGVLLFKGKRKVPRNLGLARKAIKVFFTCTPASLLTRIKSFDWRALRKRSYRVNTVKQSPSDLRSVKVADAIWNSQDDPRVDLKRPDVEVEVFVTRRRAYVGMLVWKNSEEFNLRKADKWPAPHPSAMHPGTARALVNLACARKIHDPFCGAGGFIIEAGLLGVGASGGDINPQMIARAKENCKHFGLHPELRVVDATDWLPRVPALVTDLPYGKNTKNVDFGPLRSAFLERARQSTRRMVVGLPGRLVHPIGWAIRGYFTSYVHRSITRHFYVLERSSTGR